MGRDCLMTRSLSIPYDEKVKEDEISEERTKEVEDLNKIIEITSTEVEAIGNDGQ